MYSADNSPSPKSLRVLLLSPSARSGTAGYSGEDAYTQSLLASPPPGVVYTHFEDLIAQRRADRLRWAQRYIVRAAPWAGGPIWLETFATDEPFDVVHLHAFSARIGGGLARSGTPVLLSESSLDLDNLIDYDGWSPQKVARFARRKRMALRLIGAYDQTLLPRNAPGLIVWSDGAREMHRKYGVPDSFMRVVPPQVAAAPRIAPEVASPDAPTRFLFVGANFVRKNGPLVVAAFNRIRPHLGSGAQLTVVGDTADIRGCEGITHFPRCAHARILGELIPQSNIFVLPSRAEGYGIAVIEAMSAGLPAIVSDTGVLPEIVADTGIVVGLNRTTDDSAADSFDGAVDRLADAMLRLGRDGDLRAEMGQRARDRHAAIWAPAAAGAALTAAYRRAVAIATNDGSRTGSFAE